MLYVRQVDGQWRWQHPTVHTSMPLLANCIVVLQLMDSRDERQAAPPTAAALSMQVRHSHPPCTGTEIGSS